jgi:hypothetical protein
MSRKAGSAGSLRLFPYGKFAKEYANHEAPVKKASQILFQKRTARVVCGRRGLAV